MVALRVGSLPTRVDLLSPVQALKAALSSWLPWSRSSVV